MTRLLTEVDVAELLQLTPRQILRLARAGTLPTVKLPGDEIRFDAEDLAAWLAARKQLSTPTVQL